METKKLRPYQEQGVRRIVEIARERDVILADEPGLGKTIQVAAFLNITRPDTVLVVCPASLTINWKKELDKWLEYTPGNLCVLSYSRIRRASGNAVTQWDVVVFDEAHYLKNPDAQRTKASLKIPAHRRLFLTGTPIVNRPIDLWPILSAMGTKLSKQEYGVRYCNGHLEKIPLTKSNYDRLKRGGIRGVVHKDGRYYRLVWDFSGASNTHQLGHALKQSCMVRRTKSEVLDELPKKTRHIIEIDAVLGDPAYLRREIHASFNAAKDNLDEVFKVAFEKMSATRLEQAIRKVHHCVPFVENLLEEEEKIVIFAYHREVIECLRQNLTEKGISTVVLYGGMTAVQKDRSVEAFQKGDARVFIGQIAAAGVGLTLTAAKTAVFLELDWVPGNVIQAEDRIHRIGQTDPVRIFHLVMTNSVDSTLVHALVNKQNTIQEVMTNAQ